MYVNLYMQDSKSIAMVRLKGYIVHVGSINSSLLCLILVF